MERPMTEAAELRAAATKLRHRLADPQLTAGPWLSLDHGDRLIRNQPGDEDRAPVYVVNEPMSNGANADYIALMHPGVGAALAVLLDDAAVDAEMVGPDPSAVAIARLINATES
jgi:hypothetical protein